MNKTKRPSWAMGGVTGEAVDNYIYSLLPESDPVLRKMEEEAAKRDIPIVGPAVGRLLYMLARLSGARRVFEMGSAIGYSTIWWALGVGEEGHVVYTDGDSNRAMEAYKNFEQAGVEKRIEIKVGDALEILSEQNLEPFDIIFNDVDKEDYPKVFRLAVPRIRRGGLFVTDNVLWSGRVADPANKEREESTRAILEFNRLLYGSKELFPTILPLRDGVAVALKQ
ncbi:MAG TPA: O-methyltransferase [Terriglobales bacterium]|nr:O-methyltransferase [Terriglobales bacterium]